jgi:phosphoglycerate-specific signal transduction histidine kinase
MQDKEREFIHDINNKLTMIHGKLFKVRKTASDEQKVELDKIEKWCEESFDIIKGLRDFLESK